MSNIKISNVAGRVPTTAHLKTDEIGVNTADGSIFTNNGSAIKVVNKPSAADISTKVGNFETSLVDFYGQDLRIRTKRAMVGQTNKLTINYGTDWNDVDASGNWRFTGDIRVDKENPWLTLDSVGTGDTNNEQAAGISIGEAGKGAASLHLSYIGDGYSYVGMGSLGSDNIADNWAMKMNYQNTWVQFRSALLVGNGDTKLSKGSNNSLKIKTNHGYVDIGPENTNHCHYSTDRPSHYFNRKLLVNGDIYAGSSYDKRVYHEGWKPTYTDVGAIPSKYLQQVSRMDANSASDTGVTFSYLHPSATNKPDLANGTDYALTTTSFSTVWSTQTASDWRLNEWYVRKQEGGAWGKWAQVQVKFYQNSVYGDGESNTGATLTTKTHGSSCEVVFMKTKNNETIKIGTRKKGDVVKLIIVNPVGTVKIQNESGNTYLDRKSAALPKTDILTVSVSCELTFTFLSTAAVLSVKRL